MEMHESTKTDPVTRALKAEGYKILENTRGNAQRIVKDETHQVSIAFVNREGQVRPASPIDAEYVKEQNPMPELETCGCGRPIVHKGLCKFRRAQQSQMGTPRKFTAALPEIRRAEREKVDGAREIDYRLVIADLRLRRQKLDDTIKLLEDLIEL